MFFLLYYYMVCRTGINFVCTRKS